jgi:DNA-binding transcriptional ArsR family regulator
MQEEKITLDKDVFRTLASGTRVDIIKSLDKRRKTLSELSSQFGMSVSTVKEHLDNLVAVGLIVQMDEGHKWKYYELTKKGKSILHPEDKKIWILLGMAALGMLGLVFDLASKAFFMASFSAMGAIGERSEGALMETQKTVPSVAADYSSALQQLPYLHIAGFVLFGLVIAVSIAYIVHTRKNIKI